MHREFPATSSTDTSSYILLNKDVMTCNDANGDRHPSPVTHDGPSQTSAKKPTRQWAAWTRQEEESFFNALRQVGKNFEKITNRVQSKNKDQVRHYYYRLIKRINKLLGPTFTLDAKNSTDANAAMLRWWSLLEKHSCSASKLHLKPRRFKIFVAALEHQLLKDRKKAKRKASQAEHTTSQSLVTVPVPSKAPINETHEQLVTLEGHGVHKTGVGRGNTLKRNLLTSIGCLKDEMPISRTARQRRGAGGSISSKEYKRWEKAAMAGVSLVADAAVQLERASDRFPSDVLLDKLPCEPLFSSEAHRDVQIEYMDGHPMPPSGSATTMSTREIMRRDLIKRQTIASTNLGQTASLLSKNTKLKLQLFPIDDYTRKGMEKDGHNPYLELTVRAQKKISSIIEHLSRKWGNSSIASGELMLFPYAAHQGYVASHQRWTLKDSINASDVSTALGSPADSRLRYGWFSSTEPSLRLSGQFSSHLLDVCLHSDKGNLSTGTGITSMNQTPSSVDHVGEAMDRNGSLDANRNASSNITFNGSQNDKIHSGDASNDHGRANSCIVDNEKNLRGVTPIKNNLQTSSSEHPSTPWLNEESTNGFLHNLFQNAGNMQQKNTQKGVGATFAAAEWADSVTNYSMGDLLHEASVPADAINFEQTQSAVTSSAGLHPTSFCSDSFDAAIAAHMACHQNTNSMSANICHPSIWDAEDTRDAFSFQKNCSSQDNVCHSSRNASTENGGQSIFEHTAGCAELVEELDEAGYEAEDVEADPESIQNQDGEKNFGILDTYWPDSLGCMLDFGFSSSRLQSQCLLNADSLSSLSGLIASSLDAFQNCAPFSAPRRSHLAKEPSKHLTTASPWGIL